MNASSPFACPRIVAEAIGHESQQLAHRVRNPFQRRAGDTKDAAVFPEWRGRHQLIRLPGHALRRRCGDDSLGLTAQRAAKEDGQRQDLETAQPQPPSATQTRWT